MINYTDYPLNLLSEERLRTLVVLELIKLKFIFNNDGTLSPPNTNKADLKEIHRASTTVELRKSLKWLVKNYPKNEHYFANGCDVNPAIISPKLVQVTTSKQNDLFRIARLTWSLPYTTGFGRRLRYLIIDEANDKLMGVFGLQSAPISFWLRDNLFVYPKGQKTVLVNKTMDVFTLGAIPPYNFLLGGKLVGLAVSANQVRKDYCEKYSNRATEIEHRILPADLVALTTTSAFGRSSIYNRLNYPYGVQKIKIAQSLGFTKGYGIFHLQNLYYLLKKYLEINGTNIQGGYGKGPKRSWQLMRKALQDIGLSGELLKHGVQREAFIFPLVDNLTECMQDINTIPIYRDLPFDQLAAYWKERWMLPRASRNQQWQDWDNIRIKEQLFLTGKT